MSSDQTLTIQCLLIRKGGTVVELGQNVYHFAPNAAGDHVAEVADADDAGVLLGIREGYKLYSPKKVAPTMPAPVAPVAATLAPVAPVTQKEPVKAKTPTAAEKAAEKKAALAAAEAAKTAAPMGLPGAPVSLEAMAAMPRDQVAAIFKTEVGRDASAHAEVDVLIAQIKAKREEAAG